MTSAKKVKNSDSPPYPQSSRISLITSPPLDILNWYSIPPAPMRNDDWDFPRKH